MKSRSFAPLPLETRRALQARVEERGFEAVSAELGLAVPTMHRCVAGAGVAPGTHAIIKLGLAETSPRPAA